MDCPVCNNELICDVTKDGKYYIFECVNCGYEEKIRRHNDFLKGV